MPDAPTHPTRLYTREFFGVVAVNFLSFAQWFGLNPILPLVIIGLGGDAAVAGLAFFVFSVPSLIFRPIFGALSDRFGARVIMLWSTLGIGLAALFYLVPSLAALMVVRALHGVAWAADMTATPALMARLVPASRRGEAASIYDLMPSLAQLAMPAIGLLVYTATGAAGVFVLATALGLAAWLGVIATLPRDAPTTRPAPGTGRMPMLEPSAILPMLIVVLFMSAAPLFVIYPPILATQNGIPLTDLAIYYPVFGLAMVGSRILVSKVIDRLPRPALVVAGALLAITGLVGALLSSSIITLTITGVFYAGAIGVLIPAITAAVMDRAPAGRMGSAMGTYTLGFQFAGGMGAALWGFVIQQSGFLAAYWMAIGMQVVLLAVALLSRRQLAHEAIQAPAH